MDASTAADWNALVYHRVSEPQVAWGRAVLAGLPLGGDEVVLDVGCGTGRLTQELLARLPRGRVIAVDRSPAMLEVAGRHVGRDPRVQLVCAEALALPVGGTADVIFSTATLHWVLDHPALFRSMCAALKPGGRLLAQCGGRGNLARLIGRASVLVRRSYAAHFAGWRDPWEFPDSETTVARLRTAGFTGVSAELQTAPTSFAGAAEFAEFVACICIRPYLERLPPPERPRFVASLVEQAAADHPPFTLDYCRLSFSARKVDTAAVRGSSATAD